MRHHKLFCGVIYATNFKAKLILQKTRYLILITILIFAVNTFQMGCKASKKQAREAILLLTDLGKSYLKVNDTNSFGRRM